MSLVQRVILVLLYCNATSKEVSHVKLFICLLDSRVYSCLYPFMVCISPISTSDIIDKLVIDYDIAVLNWTKELLKYVQVSK